MLLNEKQAFSVFPVMMLDFCKEYVVLCIFSLKLLDEITKQLKKIIGMVILGNVQTTSICFFFHGSILVHWQKNT